MNRRRGADSNGHGTPRHSDGHNRHDGPRRDDWRNSGCARCNLERTAPAGRGSWSTLRDEGEHCSGDSCSGDSGGREERRHKGEQTGSSRAAQVIRRGGVKASGELRKTDRIVRYVAMALLFCLGFPRAAPAQQPSPPLLPDLSEKSLEDLMDMQVTSVSKKEQKLSQVAAAIFVITQEDIRRSGATNIPDLLRMVPGLDVAQINGNTWAISARGFNLQFANKLLVLIDGRAVYSPLFGGVNWDTQDVPLEDIERIEVIRGPGGTIWGANAVNGVINIITKRAGDTHGALVSGGGGTTGQSLGTVQYGGNFGGDRSYRIFTKYLNVDHLPDLQGQDASDGYHLLHGGFRADAPLSANDALTVQGDLYVGREGAAVVHSSFDPPDNEK